MKPQCGHPTRHGGACRKGPLTPGGRCAIHARLPPTPKQQEAARRNPVKHAYFVAGFLDEEERELFHRVLEGTLEPGALRGEVVAALVVRCVRMLRWEAEGKKVAALATAAFAELRQSLAALQPGEMRVRHSWDDAEVAAQVQRVLQADPELVARLVPPALREKVREALRGQGGP